MSLRILIDEDSQAKPLISLLKKAGHDVITANEADLAGEIDELVLDYAKRENRVLLTHNCDDFQWLHRQDSHHFGILVIYQNDFRSKNMSRQEIVKAIANLETANISLVNQFISLNQWDY